MKLLIIFAVLFSFSTAYAQEQSFDEQLISNSEFAKLMESNEKMEVKFEELKESNLKINQLENQNTELKQKLDKLEVTILENIDNTESLESWGVTASFVTGIATIILAIILIKQTITLQNTSKLASGPKIFPRYIQDQMDGKIHIYLYNVGKGNAIDIQLELKDLENNSIGHGTISRYSLTNIDVQTFSPLDGSWRPEFADTGVSFDDERFSYRITGYYRDTNEKIIRINQVYEYPPKIVN